MPIGCHCQRISCVLSAVGLAPATACVCFGRTFFSVERHMREPNAERLLPAEKTVLYADKYISLFKSVIVGYTLRRFFFEK